MNTPFDYSKVVYTEEAARKARGPIRKRKRLAKRRWGMFMAWPNPKPRFCKSECKHIKCNARKFKWLLAYNAEYWLWFVRGVIANYYYTDKVNSMPEYFSKTEVVTGTIDWEDYSGPYYGAQR